MKLIRYIIFCLLIIAFFILPAFSQKKVNAKALIDHLYTLKGQLPINDMIIVLDSYEANDSGSFDLASKEKVFYKVPCKLKSDIMVTDEKDPLNGKLITIIRNGSQSLMYISMGEMPIKSIPDPPTPSMIIPFNLQKYQESLNYQYVYLGSETIDGKKLELVSIINPNKKDPENITKVWIDHQKWIPVRVEKKFLKMSNAKPLTILTRWVYSEPKKLKDGRYIPHVINVWNDYSDGNGMILTKKIIYTQLSVNSGLDDSLFEPLKVIAPDKAVNPNIPAR